MDVPWRERIEALTTTIDAEGVDVERTADEEARWFKHALQRPSAEEASLVADQFRWFGQRQTFGGVLLLMWLGAMIVVDHGAAWALLPFIALIVWLVSFWVRHARASRKPREVPGRFNVTLDPLRLSVTSQGVSRCTLELATIDRFEGSQTLAALTTAGARLNLPFALASRALNEALAARLNDELARIRSAGLYRGVAREELAMMDADAAAEARERARNGR